MNSHTFDEVLVDPTLDGVTHIRISPSGLTLLGKMLCNTAPLTVELGSYGHFRTMENLWHYMRGGSQTERLKDARGKDFETLKVREPRRNYQDPEFFRGMILMGLRAKIRQHRQLQDLLVMSALDDLPFVRYHYQPVDGGREMVLVTEQSWFIEELVAFRTKLVADGVTVGSYLEEAGFLK